MKIILEYNGETGEVKDRSGMVVWNYVGLNFFDTEIPAYPHVANIIALKESGFNAEEIKMLLDE